MDKGIDLLGSLTINELQEQHQMIADAVGVDGLIRLCECFGGSSIYIPQKKELLKNKIYGMIYREYDGSNIKQLAVKYEVSEATVYNVVRDRKKKKKGGNVLGQTSFADMGWTEDAL